MKYSAMLSALAVVGLASSFATGEIVEVRYDFPSVANNSLLFGYFGGDNPVEGNIISTSLVIENYLVGAGNDGSNFFLGFDVPVVDSVSSRLALTGADLEWAGTGSFSHSFTTDDFNGTIRPGRFGAEFLGGGSFEGDAYLSFTVDTNPVPAPGTLALMGGAGLAGLRRRR